MKFGYTAYQILRVERGATAAEIAAAHAQLSEAARMRTDLPERVRVNLQRSLDDAVFTLSSAALRAEHDAWIARHENGPRLDGANAYILPAPASSAEPENAGQAPANASVSRFASVRNWLAAMRKAGSAVRMASRTLL
ncbi:MAG: hypothetical protein RL341_2241 [Pseudomonadota bacterium]|jgi:hypothetical protein